jgi:hypothetical protein
LFTCQAQGVEQDENDDTSLKRLHLGNLFKLAAEFVKPVWQLELAQALGFLLLGVFASSASFFFGVFLAVFLVFVFVATAVFLLLLASFVFKFFLSLSNPIGFFIKLLIQIRSLYSNHEIQNDEGSQYNNKNKEWIISF